MNQNILSIGLDATVDHNSLSNYADIVAHGNVKYFDFVELDFEKTSFITLPGTMYLVLIVTILHELKRKENKTFHAKLTNYNEGVLRALINFGFIEIMKTKTHLIVDPVISEYSEKQYSFWRGIIKNKNFNVSNLYFPISPIPLKETENFASDIGYFMNRFVDYFIMLIKSGLGQHLPHVEYPELRKDFIATVNEATKNVWDHSQSWGLTSIFTSRSKKTTLCLFDLGIGFINSYVKRKGEFERNSANDKEKLDWLFKEGNTSDETNNHGKGLKKIADYTSLTNGRLIIKTDKYLMTFDRINKLKISESFFFPGTQLIIDF